MSFDEGTAKRQAKASADYRSHIVLIAAMEVLSTGHRIEEHS